MVPLQLWTKKPKRNHFLSVYPKITFSPAYSKSGFLVICRNKRRFSCCHHRPPYIASQDTGRHLHMRFRRRSAHTFRVGSRRAVLGTLNKRDAQMTSRGANRVEQ